MVGCGSDPSDTGWEYAPNMFHSVPLEPFSQMDSNRIYANGLNAQRPPDGTVPRGNTWYYDEAFAPYHVAEEHYDSLAPAITSPLSCSEETVKKGKILYERFCIVCHGPKGEAQGSITSNKGGPYPPPPSYKSADLANLPEGKMFHSITYGKNLMGSYASQLTPQERWTVICYVKKLQGRLDGESAAAPADSTAAESPVAANGSETESQN